MKIHKIWYSVNGQGSPVLDAVDGGSKSSLLEAKKASNEWRLKTLFEQGGLYIDVDVELAQVPIAVEKSNIPLFAKTLYCVLPSNWAIFAPKGDLAIKWLLDDSRAKNGFYSSGPIMEAMNRCPHAWGFLPQNSWLKHKIQRDYKINPI